MSHQPDIRPDLFSGPNGATARELLNHCLILKVDPPAETFAAAVDVLAELQRVARINLTFHPTDYMIRDAFLCSYALQLTELAQRSSPTPRGGLDR